MLYQFKIKLRGIIKPPVWRRVLVPSQFTFATFHFVIQNAFGWWNEHLFQFGDRPYSQDLDITIPVPESWTTPTHDARKYTLKDYYGNGEKKLKLCYVYDFGDDWIHDIELEQIIPEERLFASCIAGKGACPEEDCGGIWGYEEMKENSEIEAPAEFDLEEANDMVKDVKNKWDDDDFLNPWGQ
ncbi:MAG: plasmid pRiA4b ORF-3 family protein [Prevotella sp.]|jgi:hypothetical protein|nr:plasmid pRiA4b ORF-3 family protein [Prevotella sp.]